MKPDNVEGREGDSEQIHLRLTRFDAELLRRCAEERGQTLSAFVRYLLRRYDEGRREQPRT